jgi:hypothetical protein
MDVTTPKFMHGSLDCFTLTHIADMPRNLLASFHPNMHNVIRPDPSILPYVIHYLTNSFHSHSPVAIYNIWLSYFGGFVLHMFALGRFLYFSTNHKYDFSSLQVFVILPLNSFCTHTSCILPVGSRFCGC